MKEDQRTNKSKTGEGKHLTFNLGEEVYGINLLKIKEIVGIMPITKVPMAPDHVKGVVNLRGKIIPLVDMRLMFGMEPLAYTDRTCIVVVEIERASAVVFVGLVVDSVSEVANLKMENIEDCPEFSGSIDTDYISGLAKTENDVKILLDIETLLDVDEIGMAA